MIIIKKTGFPLMKHVHNAPYARYLRFSMEHQYHASLKNQLLIQKLQLIQTEAETPRVSSKSRSRYIPSYNITIKDLQTCGETIEEAWYRAFHVMIACETQIRALSMGIENLILSSEEASNQVQKTVKTGGGGVSTGDTAWAIGELEWSALMNVLDTAGYHTGYAYRGPFLRNV
ncbi:unnamed protein product [Rotaria magnacalcarata]|uniref:Uncharacterized protein n=1 Tax=Rotaria magnacalcarata TaxID=392030 RepID=A0A8S2PZJ0_9BILA|nr:unnamed protein product [Rotaria magnacalcarata]CAF4074848.1 unnamed protein product [Rotaria magnacalcarata]